MVISKDQPIQDLEVMLAAKQNINKKAVWCRRMIVDCMMLFRLRCALMCYELYLLFQRSRRFFCMMIFGRHQRV
jgi:hypothetical protein